MKFLNLIFAVLLGSGLIASAITQEAPRGTVSGRITMSENGQPLSKVRVSLGKLVAPDSGAQSFDEISVDTDKEGRYAFTRIPTGVYRLSVSAKVHHAKEQSFTLNEADRKVLDAVAEPDPPSLRAYFSQHVWLPDEKPQFELTGFIQAKSVNVELKRVNANDLNQVATVVGHYEDANTKELPLESVDKFKYDVKNRDQEGDFIDKVQLGALNPGFYQVTVSSENFPDVQGFINVTDLGLVTRTDHTKTLCYLTSLMSGQPKAGTTVYRAVDGNVEKVGTTNDEGLVEIPYSPDGKIKMAYFAKDGADVAACSGEFDSDVNKGTGVLILDRPVYRPGDTILFKGLMRSLNGQTFKLPPAGTSADITIRDTDGAVLTKMSKPINEHGSFDSNWSTTSEIKPGTYEIESDCAGIKAFHYAVIAAYRKPEFIVSLEPLQTQYGMGQEAKVKVKCTYYYGAPVVGAKVSTDIFRNPDYEVNPDWVDEDDSSDDSSDSDGGGRFFGGEAVAYQNITTTDENGEAIVSMKLSPVAHPDESSGSNDQRMGELDGNDYVYNLTSTVSDTSGKALTGTASFQVAQGDFSMHLDTGGGFGPKGKPLDVKVESYKSFDASKPTPAEKVHLEASYTKHSHFGEYKRVVIDSKDVVTDEKGKASTTMSLNHSGDIDILAISKDARGNEIRKLSHYYVSGGDPDEDSSDSSQKTFTISLDKKKYGVGDIAHVLLKSDSSLDTLACIDTDVLKSYQIVHLRGGKAELDVPITPDMAPNAYVSVCAVSNKDLIQNSKSINIETHKNDMKVEVSTVDAKYLPGSKATVNVKTTAFDGTPVPAEVSLGIVDESIYAIREDHLDIRKEFLPKRSDSVQTLYSFETMYLDGGDKAPANIPVRRNFKDTAAWLPHVQTSKDGTAQVSIDLPDNLTTWRISAVGVSDDTMVGQAKTKFKTWKPLMVRLDAPTFLTSGDDQQIVVGLTNDTDKDMDVRVSLKPDNLSVDAAQAQTKHIAAGKQIDLTYDVKSASAGLAHLTAYAEAGPINDAVEKSFTVVPRGQAILDSRSGGMDANSVSFNFNLKPGMESGFGDLRVSVTPNLGGSLFDSLDDLIDYPYGCVEQTIDRFVPSLVAVKLAQDMHMPTPKRAGELPAIARKSLDRLAAFEHPDGAWGWWQYDESSPQMTATVLDGLLKAKQFGYESSQINVKSALDYCADAVSKQQPAVFIGQRNVDPNKPTDLDDRYKAERRDQDRVAIAYVLARYDRKDEAAKALQDLNTNIDDINEWPLIARTAHLLGDEALEDKMVDQIHKSMKTEGAQSYWQTYNWGSDEATSKALTALVSHDPKDPTIPQVVAYLVNHRHGNGWSSTLATADTLTALDAYLRSKGLGVTSGSVEVRVNDEVLGVVNTGGTTLAEMQQEFKVPLSRLKVGDNRVTLNHVGSGAPYYSAQLTQYPKDPVQTPANTDFPGEVSRSYRLLKPGRTTEGKLELIPSAQPVSAAQSGDIIVCSIKIKTSRDEEYVAIEDPIPSNCHVVQQTTLDEGATWNYWYSGMEILDDRVGIFCSYLDPGEHEVTYFLRAETPGLSHALPTVVSQMYNPVARATAVENPMQVRK